MTTNETEVRAHTRAHTTMYGRETLSGPRILFPQFRPPMVMLAPGSAGVTDRVGSNVSTTSCFQLIKLVMFCEVSLLDGAPQVCICR